MWGPCARVKQKKKKGSRFNWVEKQVRPAHSPLGLAHEDGLARATARRSAPFGLGQKGRLGHRGLLGQKRPGYSPPSLTLSG